MSAVPAKATTEIVAHTPTISEKFLAKVEKQFKAELGSSVAWTPLQRTLAQHLFVAIDISLKALEARRASNSKKAGEPPVTWDNLNMEKLALDVVHRVSLELDAAIKNHLFVIPYLNSRTKKYDVDLRIGYAGKDHIRRKFSIDKILDVRYQLVHEGDTFRIDRSAGWDQPVYEPKDYFNPGKVVGGFGYIMHENPLLNRVVVVEYREFEKARKGSGGVEFWGGIQKKWDPATKQYVEGEYDEKFEKEMQLKTVVHRTCDKIPVDPAKINAATMAALVEAEAEAIMARHDALEAEYANAEIISLPAVETIPDAEVTEEVPQIEDPAKHLKLTADQVNYLGEQLPEGSDVTAFLNHCIANGAKTWKQVSDMVPAQDRNQMEADF